MLTGGSTGRATLAELASHHGLVDPLDTRGDWYRYPPLLRQVLRLESARLIPAALPRLHRRPPTGSGPMGSPSTQFVMPWTAEAWDLAAELVGRHWLPLISHGKGSSLRAYVERVPAHVVHADAELALAKAGLLFEDGDEVGAEALFAVADSLTASLPEPRRLRFGAAATSISLYRARLRGDVEEALGPPASRSREPWSEVVGPELRALTLTSLGMAEFVADDFESAGDHLRQAAGLAREAGGEYLLLLARSTERPSTCARAARERAEARAGAAAELVERRGWTRTAAAAQAYLSLAASGCGRANLPRRAPWSTARPMRPPHPRPPAWRVGRDDERPRLRFWTGARWRRWTRSGRSARCSTRRQPRRRAGGPLGGRRVAGAGRARPQRAARSRSPEPDGVSGCLACPTHDSSSRKGNPEPPCVPGALPRRRAPPVHALRRLPGARARGACARRAQRRGRRPTARSNAAWTRRAARQQGGAPRFGASLRSLLRRRDSRRDFAPLTGGRPAGDARRASQAPTTGRLAPARPAQRAGARRPSLPARRCCRTPRSPPRCSCRPTPSRPTSSTSTASSTWPTAGRRCAARASSACSARSSRPRPLPLSRRQAGPGRARRDLSPRRIRRPAGVPPVRDDIVQGVGPFVLDEQGDDAFARRERLSQLAKRLLRQAAAVGLQRAFGRSAPLAGLKPEAQQRRDLAG